MVVLDDLKNLTIYKKEFFLPIDENDKKHNSAIMLLTPNYKSSISTMKAPYTINRKYFESYYLEKNVTRYTKANQNIDEQYCFEINESELATQDRNNLPDSAFGLPSQRRYPIPDKEHVLLAIKFFNHVEEEYEEELAHNIIKKIKEFQIEKDIHVGKKNRFYPYWLEVWPGAAYEFALLESGSVENTLSESTFLNESDMSSLYFISQSENIQSLSPRIPENYMTKNGYEDNKTKRVCFSTSIDGYLRGLSSNCKNIEFYIYQPNGSYNVSVPSKKQVPDVDITNERWITTKVDLKCIGKIKVIEDSGKPGHKYTYGDGKIAELYDWNWKWIDHYNESILNENYIFSKNDLYINFDKFKSGKSNICFVTGLSGSGKSTIAKSLASKHNAEWIELDIFEHCGGFNEDNLKEAGQVFYDYLSSHKNLWDRLRKHEVNGKELRDEIKKFIKYVISWCHKHKDDKYIIEGVQIYSIMDVSDIKGKPLIMINASMLKSLTRKLKRTWENRNDKDSDWKNELKNFPELIRWYIDGEKTYNDFKKELLSESTLLSESVILEANRQNIIDKVNSSLEAIGLKSHISKNGDWGSDKFLDGAESLCLGSFKKDDYNKAYNQLSQDLKGMCKISKDNYFTLFVNLKESVAEEDIDDAEFSYYFSDEIKKKFNNTVDMSDTGDDVIDEYSLMESVQTIKDYYNTLPYLTETGLKSEETNGNLYPIYIVSSFTNTKFGQLAKKIHQVKEFSHSGISFCHTLSKIYSFNADNKINVGKGGFSIESLREYINIYQDSIINVNVFFVKYKYFNIIQEYVNNMIKNIQDTSYNKTNLLKIILNKASDDANSLSMICSQFVYSVLKQAGYDPLHKADNLVTPDELASLEDVKVFRVYTGLAKDYTVGKIGNAVSMIAKKAKSINEGYIEESSPVNIETCTGIILDKKSRILVELHKRSNSLNIPGGKIDTGESEINALKRELNEELGINVIEAHFLYNFTFGFNYIDDNTDYICTDHIYMIKNYDGKITNKEPEKHGFVKFMSVNEIMMYHGDISKVLQRFISQYGHKFVTDPEQYMSKFISSSNIVYSGYQSDISITRGFMNQKSLQSMFNKCSVKYPEYKITIIVSGSKSDYAYIDENNITVLSKKAFETEFKGYSYNDYIKFVSAIFVYHTVNPNVIDQIANPLSMFKSGTIDDKLSDKNDHKYDTERLYKYIYQTYGDKALINIVKSNSIKTVYSYMKEMIGHIKVSSDTLKEMTLMLEEENESQPITLDDVQNIGSSITRKIKQASVYKMNKITRDIQRGNVGKDSHVTTSLQKLQSGELGKIDIPITTPSSDSSVEELCSVMNESQYLLDDNMVYLFEDIDYDTSLKNALYDDRIRNAKQVLEIYKKVKQDCPFIRYAFADIKKYGNKNVFFDLSYYNEAYFKNATISEKSVSPKSLKIYKELMVRLINDSRFTSYKKKTLFIPILDWKHNDSTKMWIYKLNLNPISIIYNMINTSSQELKEVFGDIDIVFMGHRNYFKINFSKVDVIKDQVGPKFINLIKRIISIGGGAPDPDPVDEPENSQKGIAMDIVDKVEKSQNIEIKSVKAIMSSKPKNLFDKKDEKIDGVVKKIESDKSSLVPDIKTIKSVEKTTIGDDKGNVKNISSKKITTVSTIKTSKEDIIKATKVADTNVDHVVNVPNKEKQKEELVTMIAKAAEDASNSDDAMDNLDDEVFKALLLALKDQEEENIRVSKARAARIVELSTNFQSKEVSGKSVKELLLQNPNDIQLPKTTLPVKTSEKCWSDMTFMNFDKTYDPDSDIVKMLDNMKNWSYPVAVRDIKVTDNSTSEDYINLWDIDCEDFKGTRFKLKVDIPKFINDKFLKLRGNEKSLMLQSTLMPIIKTDLDTCQIIGVGGYNKIFVRRYGSGSGKSMSNVDRLIKTLNRYEDNDITIIYGDNTKICNKYELPIDYIDLATYYDSIETNQYKLYFNQDELRKEYEIDDTKGLALGVLKANDGKNQSIIIYYDMNAAKSFKTVSKYISYLILGDVKNVPEIMDLYNSIIVTGKRYMYSKASILSIKIPLVIVCAYVEGLTTTLKKANIQYEFKQKLEKYDRFSDDVDYIKFSDGYLFYENNYVSSMLMNGLKECDTESYSLKDMNTKEMYMDFLTNFGGNLKSDGLDNSYDCMIDPITREILEIYKLPTEYVSVLLYANALLADNKFIKHTDMSVRRLRRKELIAGYFYKALTAAYQSYASQIRHTRKSTKMSMKQSAVIDMILSKDPSTNDLSINNAINDVESANTITSKGLVGMNTDRAYSLDKRGYDPTMLNIVGMSTGFSGTVGINRQATIDCNVLGARGFVAPIDANTDKFSTAKTLTITEALTPFGSTHDDPFRTLMTYIQTSKHMVRTEHSDPLLVTNGSDEAMPYLTSDIFAFKAKNNGKVIEISIDPKDKQSYMIVEYKDGSHDFIDLSEDIKKNSDGGYYVPMKLSTDLKVGDNVKSGEILAYDKKSFSNNIGESGNLALNIGTFANVAIINTDEGYEDSAACTESFARKLGTEVIVKHSKTINKEANVFLMKKIGEQVMEGDTILSYQTSFDDEIANSLLRNLSMNSDEISELGRNPIKSHYSGILTDIKIYRTVEMEELSPSLQKLVRAYESNIKKTKQVYNKYNLDSAMLPATQKLGNTGKTKNVYDGILIEFYIKYIDNMSIGDKVVLYSANKGIIKYLIPDGLEPYTDFRPEQKIDLFVSIGSINGRMVCSTQLYGALAKLMVELDRTCKDIAHIPYDTSKI